MNGPEMMEEFDPEEARRRLEKMMGLPRGSADPTGKFFEDAARLNKALGGGMAFFQNLIGPRELMDRIESRMDTQVHNLKLITNKVLRDIKPPSLDGRWRGGQ